MSEFNWDVAIIGGGPAGSTAGCILKKYDPNLRVLIVEKETFPRDHVGESQLPVVSQILAEIGAWDKVESAGFPIKVGATYRWGSTPDLWHFNFVAGGKLDNHARPEQYAGQRTQTAFQVDRSRYDLILLEHAAELGCAIRQPDSVTAVRTEGDRILSLDLKSGETISARQYIDASGVSTIFRKAFDVPAQTPSQLRNIAIWDYWNAADWAVRIGTEGTKSQILSLGWGWMWFISVSGSRTSVGLVTPAEHFKKLGLTTEDLYAKAISEEPTISKLLAGATSENNLQATKDWSFTLDRLCGENWFIVGDAGGFADPILSAGMALAQMGAKRAAYSILEILDNPADEVWLKQSYEAIQSQNTRNHIMLADYWYSANGVFTELQSYCSEIAESVGLKLDPESAFAWLSTGGFTSDLVGLPFSATFRLGSFKGLVKQFSGEQVGWKIFDNNIFTKSAQGAIEETYPLYANGEILRVPCLVRGNKKLPLHLVFKYVWDALERESEILCLAERFLQEARRNNTHLPHSEVSRLALECLESLVLDGWVKAEDVEGVPKLPPNLMVSIGSR